MADDNGENEMVIVFMVQYMSDNKWMDYQAYDSRREAGKTADWLTKNGNQSRIILNGVKPE